MKKMKLSKYLPVTCILLLIVSSVKGQTWAETNLELTSPGTHVTRFQFAEHTWTGSHAILFNAYKQVTVDGSLAKTGNTKYANNQGPHGGGAGAIMFFGNGGTMDFLISPGAGVSGQGTDITWGMPKMRILRNGNIGMGTLDPTSPLEIEGIDNLSVPDLQINSQNSLIKLGANQPGPHGLLFGDHGTGGLQILYRTTPNLLVVEKANDASDGVDLFSIDYDTEYSYFKGRVGIGISTPQAGLHLVDDSGLQISNSDRTRNSILAHGQGGLEVRNGNGVPMMSFDNGSRKVGIGTTTPQNELSVNGTIWAKEIRCSLTDGADWVFEDDYELLKLEEVEAFIKENKHLPEVPSAEEFRQNDLNVAEMDNKLLQKIEELTLYLIEQNKQNQSQQAEIEELKKEIKELKNL